MEQIQDLACSDKTLPAFGEFDDREANTQQIQLEASLSLTFVHSFELRLLALNATFYEDAFAAGC